MENSYIRINKSTDVQDSIREALALLFVDVDVGGLCYECLQLMCSWIQTERIKEDKADRRYIES